MLFVDVVVSFVHGLHLILFVHLSTLQQGELSKKQEVFVL